VSRWSPRRRVPSGTPEEERPVVSEKLADSAGVRHVHLEADAEHVLIPSDARVDIGDCQREVVQPGRCDRGRNCLHDAIRASR
jgi:hypothetical protein